MGRPLNPSLANIVPRQPGQEPALKPSHAVNGGDRTYYSFPGGGRHGILRRQIGEGHSQAERDLRRRAQKERIRLRKATRADFAAWLETLSPTEAAFARAHKLHRPMPEGGFPSTGADSPDALDGAEYEPIPHGQTRGARNGRPIVAFEHPHLEAERAAGIDRLTDEEVATAAEDFATALRWALDIPAACGRGEADQESRRDHKLVALGKRCAVLIATLQPDLVQGLHVVPELARECLRSLRAVQSLRDTPPEPLTETLARLAPTGQIYERYLEWIRRGRDLAALGERLQLVAYQLRPDLIDAATLAQLGEATNKTRQAGNKKANALRDTFAGLQALCQRPDITRLRCRHAQLGLPLGLPIETSAAA